MKIGVVADPSFEPIKEIQRLGKEGFDFVELALEPPLAAVTKLDPQALHRAANAMGVDLMLRASEHLPIGSQHLGIDVAVRTALREAVELARDAGVQLLTVPSSVGQTERGFSDLQDYYIDLLGQLAHNTGAGLSLALANSARNEREILLFIEIFRHVPQIRLALDIGHANVNTSMNLAREFLNEPILSDRLSHIYVSENDGSSDQHLPLGAIEQGVDWIAMIEMLRKNGYDGTVSLDIRVTDNDYLLLSREKFRAWWEAAR